MNKNPVPKNPVRIKFQYLTDSDLARYARFVDWQLITLPESELDYWQTEAEAVNVETAFRRSRRMLAQSLADLKAGRVTVR